MNVLYVLGLLSLTTALPAEQHATQQQQQQVEEIAKLVVKKQVVATALAPLTDAAYDTVQHVVKTAIDTGAAKALFNGGIQAATHLIAVELQEMQAQAVQQAVTAEIIQRAQQKMIAAGFKEATKIAARAAAKEAAIHKYVTSNVEEFLTEQINEYLTAAVVEAAASYVMQEVVGEMVTQTLKMMVVERTLKATSVAVIEATLTAIIVEAATDSAQEIVKAEVIESSMQQAFTSMLFDNLMEGCTAVVETPVAARKTLRESVDYWYEYINAIWHSGASWHGPA